MKIVFRLQQKHDDFDIVLLSSFSIHGASKGISRVRLNNARIVIVRMVNRNLLRMERKVNMVCIQ